MGFIDWLISLVLGFIMLSIGLALRRDNFRTLFSAPRALIFGISLQLILLPLIAFSIAYLVSIPPAFKVGIIILAATPGGMTSNFISYLLKANTALAVSLTICNSFITMLSVPLVVNLGLDAFYGSGSLHVLPFWPTAGRIFGIVLLPVTAGLVFQAYFAKTARRLRLGFRWLSMFLLLVVFLIKIFAPTEAGGSALRMEEVMVILPVSLLINVLALSSGRIIGWLGGFDRNDQLTMGVEVGIQNTSLAFLIAGTLLGNEDMLKPALIYASFSFLTALAYGFLLKPEQLGTLKKELNELKKRLKLFR